MAPSTTTLLLSAALFFDSWSFASARTFTVVNSCSFTVWPAVFTDPNVGTSKPDVPTGWEAAPGSSRSFSVPDDWKSGRIWGRTGCNFAADGTGTCETGQCNGGLQCDPTTGTGVPPATLAEWTLQSSGNNDFYDTSLVDGYNLPMSITTNVDCPTADCNSNLLPSCPSELAVQVNGQTVGCKSSCLANLDGDPSNSPNCCTGSFSTGPGACPNSGVQFYSFFKQSCKNSYIYAYDESSGSALWECSASKNADYTLTFCGDGSSSPAPAPASSSSQGSSSASASASATPAALAVNASPSSSSSTSSASATPSRVCRRRTKNKRRSNGNSKKTALKSHRRLQSRIQHNPSL